MITFLSSPKPFIGHAGIIQRNAILSWLAVHPEAEVIIYGDSKGTADVCCEMGVHHVANISCSPSGIPYFNSIVNHASTYGRHDVQCYINCDILMTKWVTNVTKLLSFQQYLVIGQRINLADGIEYSMPSANWKEDIIKFIETEKAYLEDASGMDYFIFPRGLWKDLPSLVIGRGGYDAALLAFCLRRKIPLINATLALQALHQFHDYSHVIGGKNTVFNGVDVHENIRVHNIKHSRPNSADAQWLIINNSLVPNNMQRDWLRRVELSLRFDMKFEILAIAVRLLWRLAVAYKIIRPKQFTIEDIKNTLTK